MKRRYELGVGCLLVVAMAAAAFMALQVGAIGALGQRRIHVQLPMDDALGVSEGAVVAVAGVEVGKVEELSVVHDQAVVHLALDVDEQLREDVVAQVRARSVLGEKYIELTPRSQDAPLLEDGDVLDPARPRTEIDQLVNALGPLVEAVDPAQLEATLATTQEALEEDPERLARMLRNGDDTLARLAEASEDAPALVRDGRATLKDARRVLATVEDRADEAEAVIARADRLLEDLEAAAEPVPEVVEEVRLTMDEVRALLAPLEGSGEDVAAILDNLSEIDRWELRRLLREEGIVVRLKARKVEPGEENANARPKLRRSK